MCVYAHTSQRWGESRISKNCNEEYFSFNFPQVLSWKHFYSFWGKQQLCDTAKILKEPTSLNHLFSTLNLNITLDILSVFLFVILVEVFLRKQGRRWKTRKWDFYSSGGQPPWNVHHTSRMPLHSPLRWNSFLKAGCFSPKHIGRLPWVKGTGWATNILFCACMFVQNLAHGARVCAIRSQESVYGNWSGCPGVPVTTWCTA